MKSWEEFGLWINSLCQGMDVLPDDARAKVHELTDTCATDWDKVRVLYNLLRRHTRYVSIQLGIGGYRVCVAQRFRRLQGTDQSDEGHAGRSGRGFDLYAHQHQV